MKNITTLAMAGLITTLCSGATMAAEGVLPCPVKLTLEQVKALKDKGEVTIPSIALGIDVVYTDDDKTMKDLHTTRPLAKAKLLESMHLKNVEHIKGLDKASNKVKCNYEYSKVGEKLGRKDGSFSITGGRP